MAVAQFAGDALQGGGVPPDAGLVGANEGGAAQRIECHVQGVLQGHDPVLLRGRPVLRVQARGESDQTRADGSGLHGVRFGLLPASLSLARLEEASRRLMVLPGDDAAGRARFAAAMSEPGVVEALGLLRALDGILAERFDALAAILWLAARAMAALEK